uniref:Uncharacterized protein n=1 Tax=viral metagenome TaxID=1070528 RepID=A0A6C0I3A4_9ZZZZ
MSTSTLILLDRDKITILGKYKDEDLCLKFGKYGHYLQHGQETHGLKPILTHSKKTIETISFDDVVDYLENKPFKIDKNVLRILNPHMSVRRGKFGAYIYYKTSHMREPKFFSLKGFSEGWRVCSIDTLISWVNDTYDIDS